MRVILGNGGGLLCQVYHRLVAALIIFQLTLMSFIAIKKSPLVFAILPLMIITALFVWCLHTWYFRATLYMPRHMAAVLDSRVGFERGDKPEDFLHPHDYVVPCLRAPPATPTRWRDLANVEPA